MEILFSPNPTHCFGIRESLFGASGEGTLFSGEGKEKRNSEIRFLCLLIVSAAKFHQFAARKDRLPDILQLSTHPWNTKSRVVDIICALNPAHAYRAYLTLKNHGFCVQLEKLPGPHQWEFVHLPCFQAIGLDGVKKTSHPTMAANLDLPRVRFDPCILFHIFS